MTQQNLSMALFSEILAMDHIAKSALAKALPKGMEISHFAVLNYLHTLGEERSPGQLARSFSVTKGAMTNTLSKLETAGYVAIRPAWDDARRKLVAISPAGVTAHDLALGNIAPLAQKIEDRLGADDLKSLLRAFRRIREVFSQV